MKEYTKLPKKQLYLILVPLGILILALSLEVLMNVKDYELFTQWMARIQNDESFSEEELFNIYISGNMSMYFIKIIIPIGLSIHTYFSYTKIRINKLFVFMWTVLLVGSAAYALAGFNLTSVFSYIYIVLYAVVIYAVLSLSTVISNNQQT